MANLVRRDRNHAEVMQGLIDAGRPVWDVSRFGGFGCDLLTEHVCGRLVLLEVKDGEKPPSARKLTDSEKRLYMTFPGSFHVVLNLDHALEAVGLLPARAMGG